MLNISSLKTYPFSYPIIRTDSLIETNAYNELKIIGLILLILKLHPLDKFLEII